MKNALNKFISSLDFLFGLVGIVMILIATYAVFARNILIVSTPWSDELLKLLFVWSIYIGSAILFMNDGLISLTLIEDKIQREQAGCLWNLESNPVSGWNWNLRADHIADGYDCRNPDENRGSNYRVEISALDYEHRNPAWPGTDRASRTCETGRIKRIFCDKK